MGESLFIRAAVPEDAAALLKIYAPYVTETAVTFEYDIPSEAEFAGRIKTTLKHYPWLVAEADGVPVGYAYVSSFKSRAAYDWSVETSIYVDRSVRQRGVGRALYTRLEEVLRAQGILNLNACIAYPHKQADAHLNYDSRFFHEKLGYQLNGRFTTCGYKFNTWYDMIWMEKLIGAHDTPAPAVRFFPAVRGELGL